MESRVLKIILATFIFAILSQAVHSLGTFWEMEFYQDPQYFSVWSKLMMPKAGSPPLSFYGFSLLFSLINGFIFTLIYNLYFSKIPTTLLKKGIVFGIVAFLFWGLGSFLETVLIINLPISLLFSWLVQSLAICLGGALIVARIFR